ncbi:hypothetical protein CcaCcLH18_05515 [Colletotrichum camelliae]|nr:hypothetical protein CcaCcLH18_05515 [Colletotrichum camelliae]
MTQVKAQWDWKWEHMKCLKFLFESRDKEDAAAYSLRKAIAKKHLFQTSIDKKIHLELLENGFISNDSTIWRGIEDSIGTVDFRSVLLVHRIETVPGHKSLFAEIFFGLLQHLLSISEIDSRAQGVANSIWQSMRIDVVHHEHPELPDIVSEELFRHPAVLETPFETIKLDETRDGEYHQGWLIDRIMTNGCLWVGRYMPETGPVPDTDPAEEDSLGPSGRRRTYNHQDWKNLAEEWHITSVGGSIQERLFCRMLRPNALYANDLAEYVLMKSSSDQSMEQWKDRKTCGQIEGFASRISQEVDGVTEEIRTRDFVSVFDVDGPCTIATPFDAAREMIPHPVIRSMSVCWVGQFFKLPLVFEKADQSIPNEGSSRQAASGGTNEEETETRVRCWFHVRDKVKGMWPIMDVPPWESYTVL